MMLRFRLWLARLIAGTEFVSGARIGYPGSVGALCGHIQYDIAEKWLPVGIRYEVGYRFVSDLKPGNVRFVVEAPR